MTVRRHFLVERYVAAGDVASVAAALRLLAGSPPHGARHVCSLVIPDEETCLSVFEGTDASAVAAVNETAGLPLERIVEAEWIPGRPT